ncbi:MAG: NAD(P) transhydrogenase subunit alpha [Bacteroidota bacterium]
MRRLRVMLSIVFLLLPSADPALADALVPAGEEGKDSVLAGSAPRELPAGARDTLVQHRAPSPPHTQGKGGEDYWPLFFVFVLSTFIGLGVIARVSRLLHTPLMSLTNAISAIAVVGAIIVAGSDYPADIRFLGAVALFASMTNIVSGFLITDRMLKMFKRQEKEAKP